MARHRRPRRGRERRAWLGVVAAGVAVCCAAAGATIAWAMSRPGPGGSAAPAQRVARGLPDKAAGPASSRPASPAPAAPRPARRGPAHAAPTPAVPGRQVTAIGDSVMVASTPALDQAMPGIFIDAVVGRQFSTGLQVLAGLKAQGLMRPIVVFALGTNGTVTAAEIRQLYAIVGPRRRVVLVNTFEARPWEREVNAILAWAAAHHPGTVLANWFATIEHRTYLLWPDGIHPQPAGGIVYARMLKEAVERAAALPGPPGLQALPGAARLRLRA